MSKSKYLKRLPISEVKSKQISNGLAYFDVRNLLLQKMKTTTLFSIYRKLTKPFVWAGQACTIYKTSMRFTYVKVQPQNECPSAVSQRIRICFLVLQTHRWMDTSFDNEDNAGPLVCTEKVKLNASLFLININFRLRTLYENNLNSTVCKSECQVRDVSRDESQLMDR